MNNLKVVAIIQARMGSTRLPGKVLKKILGKPMLRYLVDRLSQAKLVDELVIATTENSLDDDIVKFCNDVGINCFRGSEDNVLSRYYQAAKKYKANCVVRICSDSPLIDPLIVDRMVKIFLEGDGKYDYVSNTINQTYPLGMNVEVFSQSALQTSFFHHTEKYEMEHVTPYIYRPPELFNICDEHLPSDYSFLRLTVDEDEDFILIKEIINYFSSSPKFTLDDILELFGRNTDIFKINSHVQQKEIKFN